MFVAMDESANWTIPLARMSLKLSRRQANLISLRCRLVLAQMHFHALTGSLVARLRVELETDPDVTVVSLDGAVRTTQSPGPPSSANFARSPLRYCRLCACFTGNHRCTAGGMMPVPAVTSARRKAANKEMHLPRHCWSAQRLS